MTEQLSKMCLKCKLVKSYFHVSNKTKDGRTSWCSKCMCNEASRYNRTKKGLLTKMYHSQIARCVYKNRTLPNYTKQELGEWLFSRDNFEELYVNWENSGYKKHKVPSCDRIDDMKSYTLDNLNLVTWGENYKRSLEDRKNGINNKINKAVVQKDLDGNILSEFYSQSHAQRQTGVNQGLISACCRGAVPTASGYKWEFKGSNR